MIGIVETTAECILVSIQLQSSKHKVREQFEISKLFMLKKTPNSDGLYNCSGRKQTFMRNSPLTSSLQKEFLPASVLPPV